MFPEDVRSLWKPIKTLKNKVPKLLPKEDTKLVLE